MYGLQKSNKLELPGIARVSHNLMTSRCSVQRIFYSGEYVNATNMHQMPREHVLQLDQGFAYVCRTMLLASDISFGLSPSVCIY